MPKNWNDKAWRDHLAENIDDAILFFLPELAADRDYSREPEFLSNELPAIGSDSNKGARYADLVVSIPMKTGPDLRLILHIEQQHAHDPNLPHRMHQSYYRLSDRHRLRVTTLAILTGNRTGEIELISTYKSVCYGTELLFKYNVYDINRATEEELKNDPRIFAVAILAARKMLEAEGKAPERGKFALELLNLLKEREYDNRRARSLQGFIGLIMQMNNDDIDIETKREWNMLWIPRSEVVEEIRERHAREEGMEEKALQVARTMLDDGFSPEAIQKYTGLNKENILALR